MEGVCDYEWGFRTPHARTLTPSMTLGNTLLGLGLGAYKSEQITPYGFNSEEGTVD